MISKRSNAGKAKIGEVAFIPGSEEETLSFINRFRKQYLAIDVPYSLYEAPPVETTPSNLPPMETGPPPDNRPTVEEEKPADTQPSVEPGIKQVPEKTDQPSTQPPPVQKETEEKKEEKEEDDEF